MSVSSGISQRDVLMQIIESETSVYMIKAFIDTLAKQNVLDLFVHEENLKRLTLRLVEENALHGQYADLSKDGLPIQTRYVYHYADNIARIIYDNNPGEADDILIWVKPLIEIDQEPRYGLHLFYILADYAAKVKMVYKQAIDMHFYQMKHQYENGEMTVPERKHYWKKMLLLRGEFDTLLEQAFPAGIQYSYNSARWMKEKPKTFRRVNFEEAIKNAPFDEIMNAFAVEKDVYFNTRKSASEIEGEVILNFKGLILDDAFSYIEETKGHKTSNVINAVICLLQQRKSYLMNMRLIQAFYMFYRKDFLTRQKEAADMMIEAMPELYSSGNWRNIIIPS